MKKLFLILCTFIPVSLAAQCEYERREVDKFTKDTVTVLVPQLIYATSQGNLLRFQIASVNKFKGVLGLVCFREPFIIDTDNKLLLLLENENVIELTPSGLMTPDFLPDGNVYAGTVNYFINPVDYKTIQDHFIKSIRVYSSIGFYDHDLTKEQQKQLKNDFACIFH